VNPDLERYVNNATRGLWGKKRLEVREELSNHLLERAHKHVLEGRTDHEAMRKAIAELGEARTIRAGMIGVHTMPKAITAAVLSSVAAVGVVAMLSVSSAQVMGTVRMPIPQCLTTNAEFIEFTTPLGERIEQFACQGSGVWITLESLRATLEPLGVVFQEDKSDNNPDFKQWTLFFPNAGTALVHVQMTYLVKAPSINKLEGIKLADGFIAGSELVSALGTADSSFTMSGWSNPVLRIGKTRFQIGSGTSPIQGEDWYTTALLPSLDWLFKSWNSTRFIADSGTSTAFRTYTHRIQTDFTPGQILVVASREPPRTLEYGDRKTNLPEFSRAYIASVGKNGVLEYPSDAQTLRFVDDHRALKPTIKGGVGSIVVLKFTSELGFRKQTYAPVPSSRLSK
jgi:hypothetical protein